MTYVGGWLGDYVGDWLGGYGQALSTGGFFPDERYKKAKIKRAKKKQELEKELQNKITELKKEAQTIRKTDIVSPQLKERERLLLQLLQEEVAKLANMRRLAIINRKKISYILLTTAMPLSRIT